MTRPSMWLLLALVAAPAAAFAQAPGMTPVRPTDRLQKGLDNASAARDALRARFERFGAHGRPDMPLALSESPGDSPFEGAAWETGEWHWINGGWHWQDGRWVSPDALDDVSVDYASYDVDTGGPGGEDPNPDLGVGYNDGAFDGLYPERHEHQVRVASRLPLTENVKDPTHPILIIRDHRHVGGSNDRPNNAWTSKPGPHHAPSGSSDGGRWSSGGWSSSSNDSKSDKNSDPDSNKDTSGVGNFTHWR